MQSIARWADFSAGWPGAAALKAAGYTGAICYVGLGSGTKRLTAAHYQDCVANGLQVLLVAEYDTHDAEHGYATGHANAQLALDDARALGIPDTVGIACVADEHLTPDQIPTAVEYARGFHDVLGLARTGAYGFGEFVDAVHAAGLASWWWRCGSTPDEPWMTFWQRNDGTTVVGGVQVDIDEQYQPIQEDTVSFTDIIGTRKDGTPITAGDALANLYLGAYYGGGDAGAGAVYPVVNALNAKLDALTAAVAKLATSPDVTPDQLKQWLDDAVAQHVQITGTVQVGPAPSAPAVA
ncbi:uncharacterized protein DUF1906 [Amycolatopsis echigonensis]|uniref:Uncharacterized protein DUF1906 n=1 Tax=Amycolatopsis echigonensis TaxID=2576905 RepID=A0A2N3WQ25_9PSEU|nr:glycoside hydrolase domain-containing protein [Amycolatopsis niigatensis]PKV95933.1 uncharacterized protein DUF1906 [Amycolatopsis niigatensis]